MTREVKVRSGQTIWDVALQVYGAVEGAAWLAEDNMLAGWEVTVGMVLKVRPAVFNRDVVNYYISKGYHPASGTGDLVANEYNDDFNEDFTI